MGGGHFQLHLNLGMQGDHTLNPAPHTPPPILEMFAGVERERLGWGLRTPILTRCCQMNRFEQIPWDPSTHPPTLEMLLE